MSEYALAHPYLTFFMVILSIGLITETIESFAKRNKCEVIITNHTEKLEHEQEEEV